MGRTTESMSDCWSLGSSFCSLRIGSGRNPAEEAFRFKRVVNTADKRSTVFRKDQMARDSFRFRRLTFSAVVALITGGLVATSPR